MSAIALYSPAMLALAVELADYPYLDVYDYKAAVRAKTCGSTLALAFSVDHEGRIAELGLKVTACAVGQAAAAIFAKGARGQDVADLENTADAIRTWLSGESAPPDWSRLELLEPALGHPGRHDAILLPWRAAVLALFKAPVAG